MDFDNRKSILPNKKVAMLLKYVESMETIINFSDLFGFDSTIFDAEARAITLSLDFCGHMDPVQHCSDASAKIRKTLKFVISWTSSGHWTTKAPMSTSVGCQANEGSEIINYWIFTRGSVR